MIRLVSRGRFSHDFVKAIIGAPEDREPVVRKLVEGAGGKVISYYVTTGETDFLLISEANEAEAVIAALMAASGAGTISHVSTVRAWTAAEFKGIAERAGKAASGYRPPGKHWLPVSSFCKAPQRGDIGRNPPRSSFIAELWIAACQWFGLGFSLVCIAGGRWCHGHNREWSRNHPFEHLARVGHGNRGNDSVLNHRTA
jgi:uncharacterized protein with GYD domain